MKISKVTKALIELDNKIDTQWQDLWMATFNIGTDVGVSAQDDHKLLERLNAVLPDKIPNTMCTNIIAFNNSKAITKTKVQNKIREAISLSIGEDAIGN